jgi:hypothetical protein
VCRIELDLAFGIWGVFAFILHFFCTFLMIPLPVHYEFGDDWIGLDWIS